MEPKDRIELSSVGYKATVLPLNYMGCKTLVENLGVEPSAQRVQVYSLLQSPMLLILRYLVAGAGIKPT